jgi:S-(hydroxymethyl)glutathione dehydrogenase / alcohol dehydrogenase
MDLAVTGVGAVGSSVAIFVLNWIYLSVLQRTTLAGVRRLICIDINALREPVSRPFSVIDFINNSDGTGTVKCIVKMTGRRPDFTFDCVGVVYFKRHADEAVHPCQGRAVTVCAAGLRRSLELSSRLFIAGRVFKVAHHCGGLPKGVIACLVDRYVNGYRKIADLISHWFKLNEISKGFDMMHSGEAVRTAILF